MVIDMAVLSFLVSLIEVMPQQDTKKHA